MASSRFPSVCTNCKWRKKACDKKLPSCTYCTKKAIACHYPDIPPTQPNNNHATATSLSGTWKQQHNSCNADGADRLAPTARADLLLLHTISDHAYLLPLSGFPAGSSSYDSIVHKRVSRLLQAMGLSVGGIRENYPIGIHSSISLVLDDQFIAYENAFASFTPPAADVSMLMLAASLFAAGTGETTRSSQLADAEALYLTTKMLYAQLQAYLPTSLPLVQTGILVAMYEYMSGRCQVAMLTLATCAAMIQAYEMERSMSGVDVAFSNSGSVNIVWWCIIVCERLVACEIPWKFESFALRFPCPETRLCYDANTGDWKKYSDGGIIRPPRLREISTPGRGLPGAVQAGWLMDRVFKFIELPGPLRSYLSEAHALDRDLRTFLNEALDLEGAEGACCGSPAPTIRAMFIFHEHISRLSNNDSELQELAKNALTALETVSQIMLEVGRAKADGYFLTNIDAAPPCLRYSSRAALEYLSKRAEHANGSSSWAFCTLTNLEPLKSLISSLEERWQVVTSALPARHLLFD